MKKLTALFALLLCAAPFASAQVGSDVTLNVVGGLTVTNLNGLDMGDVLVGGTTTVLPINGGHYTIETSGLGILQVDFTPPSDLTLEGGSETIALTLPTGILSPLEVPDGSEVSLDGTVSYATGVVNTLFNTLTTGQATLHFYHGGTVVVPSTATPGTYTGTAQLSVSYTNV